LRGQKKTEASLPSMRIYLFQSFFVLAAYAVLMTADVVLVKHYLPDATEFAYAATLGRMVIFLPGAIVTAMFPKVASRGTTTREQFAVFLRSFSYTAIFVVVALVGCFVFSGLFARILFGIADASRELRWMIGWMALVMGFSALLNVVVQFLMAQRRFISAFPIIGFAGLYGVGSWLFHESVGQVIFVAAVCNAGALGVTLFMSLKGVSGALDETV